MTYEIGNAWDAEIDVVFTDRGVFKDNRYICETGVDWVPTLRAKRRSDGSSIDGRQLWELKSGIVANRDGVLDCFDYLYLSSNPDQQTVTLLQRQYAEGEHVADADVQVSLHMNSEMRPG